MSGVHGARLSEAYELWQARERQLHAAQRQYDGLRLYETTREVTRLRELYLLAEQLRLDALTTYVTARDEEWAATRGAHDE